MNDDSITFHQATLEQLRDTINYLDHFDVDALDFLLDWTAGRQRLWTADHDISIWRRRYGQ